MPAGPTPESKRAPSNVPVITCPQCQLVTDLPRIDRSADEFCTKCDFPLFWASAATADGPDVEATDANLRRLPGTGGRRTIGARACPTCGEHNPLTATHCLRCGNPMELPPEELRGDYLPTPAPYEPDETPLRSWVMWSLAAVAVVLLVLLILALTDVIG